MTDIVPNVTEVFVNLTSENQDVSINTTTENVTLEQDIGAVSIETNSTNVSIDATETIIEFVSGAMGPIGPQGPKGDKGVPGTGFVSPLGTALSTTVFQINIAYPIQL